MKRDISVTVTWLALACLPAIAISFAAHAADEPVRSASTVDADRPKITKTEPQSADAKSEQFGKELIWHEYPNDQRGSEFRKFWKPSKGQPTLPGRVTAPLNHRDRAVSADDFEPRASDSPGADVGRADVSKKRSNVVVPAAEKPDLKGCIDIGNAKLATACSDHR